MQTKIYQPHDLEHPEVLDHIKHTLEKGGLIVFPTETVYGIGGNALDPKASLSIYQVKGRPSDNPLIVHIASFAQLPDLVTDISFEAKQLISAFWPGPLTLVFNKSERIPHEITAGLQTVAIRYPSHPIALKVISHANLPICAPSANMSGRPSSTLFKHVKDDLYGHVDIMIDGGKSTIGLESTVLDLTSSLPTILRPGYISKSMIESVLGFPILDLSETKHTDVPKSPGMKYTHYAPQGKITVIFGQDDQVTAYINETIRKLDDDNTAVICTKEIKAHIQCKHIFDLGSIHQPDEIAANLFIALREMDQLGIKHIFTHEIKESHMSAAIMNRLLKASGYNIIYLK